MVRWRFSESTLADQLRAALSNKEGEAEQLQQTVKMLQAVGVVRGSVLSDWAWMQENSRLNSSSTDDDDGSVKKLRNRIEEQEAKVIRGRYTSGSTLCSPWVEGI